MRIELTQSPSDEDARAISEGLVAYNQAAAPGLEPLNALKNFSVFARDDQGEIVGGLRATCFWNTLQIELVWLSEDARGDGLGSEMMAKAEEFAVSHGYELALLETTDFQARPFYEKLGYEVMATLPGHPKGHETFFMTKHLGG